MTTNKTTNMTTNKTTNKTTDTSTETTQTINLKDKTLTILGNLLRQLMAFPSYDKLSCASCILVFCKKIDEKKIKVDNAIARLFEVLEPINDALLDGDKTALDNGHAYEILPGINITKVYGHEDMTPDSKKIILCYLSVLKCHANFVKNRYLEKTSSVYGQRLDELMNYDKNKSTAEINKAKEEIKEMFAPKISKESQPIFHNLINQISDKLNATGGGGGVDLRGFMDMAMELADKNKKDFIDGKINLAEMTEAATSVMEKIYADTDDNLKNTLGFDPSELLKGLKNGGTPDINTMMSKLPKEQKKMVDELLKRNK